MKNIVIDIFGPVNDIIILIGVEIKHMPKFRRGTVAYDYLYLGYDRSQTFLDMEMECVIDYFPQGCFMTRVTLPETNSIRSGKAFAITNDRVMIHQNSLVFFAVHYVNYYAYLHFMYFKTFLKNAANLPVLLILRRSFWMHGAHTFRSSYLGQNY